MVKFGLTPARLSSADDAAENDSSACNGGSRWAGRAAAEGAESEEGKAEAAPRVRIPSASVTDQEVELDGCLTVSERCCEALPANPFMP